jgi:hypothetical protein
MRLTQFENRTEPEEQREPTWLHEWPKAEREGWATKLKVIKARMNVDRTELSNEQLLRLKHAKISKEQMRHFEDNAVSFTGDRMNVREDGKAGIRYWAHVSRLFVRKKDTMSLRLF